MNHSAVATDCLTLARTIRGHLCGNCAFANSIAAEFGLGSPVTSCLRRFEIMNPGVAFCLENIAGAVDHSDPADRRTAAPTPVAQQIVECEHRRIPYRHGRYTRLLRPMPPNTRTIVLAYLDERLQLFEQAEALIRAQKPRRTKSATEWQMARLTKLREKLKNAWALK